MVDRLKVYGDVLRARAIGDALETIGEQRIVFFAAACGTAAAYEQTYHYRRAVPAGSGKLYLGEEPLNGPHTDAAVLT